MRRLRRGASPPVTHRRLLIVQIDGLSRSRFEQALTSKRMPFVRRLIESGRYHLEPMSVGLPTSTPAFQMAAFYGVRPDIPGFHYYNRERRGDIHFPRSGHAAWVEGKHSADRRGILQGGSAYGCCFTGGAENNFFTFASLTKPSGRGILSALSPYFVVAWVAGKNLALTLYEIARAVPRFVAHPRRRARRGWRWLWLKVGMGIWIRNFFTMAVSRDLYAGVPVIYVNYLDYDEAAHAYGPNSRRVAQALRGVDRAIRQLWRVMRRVPEHDYDAYILADHGQAPCTPYRELSRGRRLERWIFDEFLHPVGADVPQNPNHGLTRGIHTRRKGTAGMFQRFMNYIDEDYFRQRDPQAYEQDGVRVIAAGPNAFLYALDTAAPLDIEAIDRKFPELPEKLSRSLGIGYVLARSTNGPVCFWQGERHVLRASEPGPFAGREDSATVVQGIVDLMAMPSAGDLVIYGTDAPKGHVSYIPEHGAHAGTSPDEMHTFIVRPARAVLPLPISHPVQLYKHFMRYQNGWPRSAGIRHASARAGKNGQGTCA